MSAIMLEIVARVSYVDLIVTIASGDVNYGRYFLPFSAYICNAVLVENVFNEFLSIF